MSDLNLPDIQALVSFGKIGMAIIASRLISILSMLGIVALSAYAIYASSWQGASCVAILSIFVFIPSLKLETSRDKIPPSQ